MVVFVLLLLLEEPVWNQMKTRFGSKPSFLSPVPTYISGLQGLNHHPLTGASQDFWTRLQGLQTVEHYAAQ